MDNKLINKQMPCGNKKYTEVSLIMMLNIKMINKSIILYQYYHKQKASEFNVNVAG